MANPSSAGAAAGFSFVFVNMIRPLNPMTYDLADTLNTALAILVGVLFGTLAYVLIFPPDPRAARRYVTYRIRLGLELLAMNNPIPPFPAWETRNVTTGDPPERSRKTSPGHRPMNGSMRAWAHSRSATKSCASGVGWRAKGFRLNFRRRCKRSFSAFGVFFS